MKQPQKRLSRRKRGLVGSRERTRYVSRSRAALSAYCARVAVTDERLVHGVEQLLVAEGLGQKVHGPGLHRLDAHRDIAVAGDKNNGHLYRAPGQFLLQLQPAEAWQPHIEHQAARPLRARAA